MTQLVKDIVAGRASLPDDPWLSKFMGKMPEATSVTPGGWGLQDIAIGLGAYDLHKMGYKSASGFQYAMGTDMIVSKPTFFSAGEVGTERITVSPIGAAHGGLRDTGGMTVNVNGLSLMDNFSARKLAYELRRIQRG